jgi:hypothetical protein
LIYSALALLVLMILIFQGPYPLAMVGSPDEDLSNTLPPKITLLALGIFQFGLLLAIEAPMRGLLKNVRIWAATVLINSMIMTLYLWHVTVMGIVVSLAYFAGGVGMRFEPGSLEWWLLRPVWIAILYAALLPVVLLFAPFEQQGRPADAPIPSAVRQVGGGLLICLGIAYLALFGFGSAPVPGLDVVAFAGVIVGSAISGLLHGYRQVASTT